MKFVDWSISLKFLQTLITSHELSR